MEDLDPHLGRAGDPLLDDPLRSDPRFVEMARWYQARTCLDLKRPPKPWMPGTEPAAIKQAMRQHWAGHRCRRVIRIRIVGGQPCES